MKLEAAIRNIAQGNTAIASGGKPPMLAQVTATGGASGFAGLVSMPQVQVSESPAPTRKVHDPANPMANADGDVLYPDVNMVSEMTGLMSASRAYEANVRGFNMLEQMTEKALQIGGR
jgi:flagellar basal-body rod protein FlgC